MARPLHRSLSLSWTAQPGHSNPRLSIARRALTAITNRIGIYQIATIHIVTCHITPILSVTAVPITDAPNVTGPCLNRTIRSETAEPRSADPSPAHQLHDCQACQSHSWPHVDNPILSGTALTYLATHERSDPGLAPPCQTHPRLPIRYPTRTAYPIRTVPGQTMSRAFVYREPYTTQALWILPRRCNRQHALTFQDCAAGTCLASHRQNVPKPSLQYRDCQTAPSVPLQTEPILSGTAKPCSAQPNIAGTIHDFAIPIRDCHALPIPSTRCQDWPIHSSTAEQRQAFTCSAKTIRDCLTDAFLARTDRTLPNQDCQALPMPVQYRTLQAKSRPSSTAEPRLAAPSLTLTIRDCLTEHRLTERGQALLCRAIPLRAMAALTSPTHPGQAPA